VFIFTSVFLLNFNFLVGIRWRDEKKAALQEKVPFSLSSCQITMNVTCSSDDIYSVPIAATPFRKQNTTAFVVMVLNTEHQYDMWQSFSCPMTFPRCSYNWCVAGENKLVSYFLHF
jgi:uncharacterized protein YbdZ (MbtH family)